MNYVAKALLIVCGFMATQIHATKYICSQNVLSDAIFTTVFKTREECQKYCSGTSSVCEETGDDTVVDTLDVD